MDYVCVELLGRRSLHSYTLVTLWAWLSLLTLLTAYGCGKVCLDTLGLFGGYRDLGHRTLLSVFLIILGCLSGFFDYFLLWALLFSGLITYFKICS